MRFRLCRKPLWWFIGSGVLFVVGLFLVTVAILAKTTIYDTVVGGIYSARFIDNTAQTDSCNTILLGDVTCPGMRFQGWSMSSQDKFATCMSGTAPSSKSLSGSAKWCEDGKRGCSKPDSCRPGNKHSFYLFSVLNAEEILQGHPAEVKEMEPIAVIKSSDKFAIDRDMWDTQGIAKWSENATWELVDEFQAPLLEQVVVVPNPVAFVSIPPGEGRARSMSSENVMYLAGAATFYTQLQASVDKYAVFLKRKFSSIFEGPDSIKLDTLVRDLYRDASPLVQLGRVFSDQEKCRSLIEVLAPLFKMQDSVNFFVSLMCTDAYANNVGLAAYSKVLEMAKMKISPSDGIFFYEYEKNCRFLNEKPSFLCTQSTICPDDGTRQSCLAPSLSLEAVDALFGLFEKLSSNFEQNKSELFKFIDSCRIGDTFILQPVSLCDLVIEQLQKAGHAAIFSANPKNSKVMAAYGWTDRALAAKMIPYFVNGTVAQIMNYQNRGFPQDPISKKLLGIRAWTNTKASDIDENLFTRQQMSSKFGDRGLSFFKSAMGMDHSCAFSYRCMSQASFLADGKTCRADEQCVPTQVEGYDVGSVPGRFFGSEKFGSSDFHGVGKTKTLFVSDLFVPALFTQVDSDVAWGNIKVNVWNVSGVGMRTEKCDALDPMDRGIDCRSPSGTINIGYNAIYMAGGVPTETILPLYSSYPHFQAVTPDSVRLDSAYEPLSRVKIFSCDSCPANRDFSTYLYTDPETGAHVKGSQKIQLNMRLSASPATLTDLPSSTGALQNGSVIINANTDVTIPLYWVDKFDSAAGYQKDQVAFVQSIPSTVNIVFWVALWVGILALTLACFVLYRGIWLRKSARGSPAVLEEQMVDQKALEAGDSCSVATVNT